MRTLTDEEKEKLMDELIKSIIDAHTQHPHELTTQEFAAKVGMSYGFAKRYLAQQIKEGKMTKRRVTIERRTFTVYSVI